MGSKLNNAILSAAIILISLGVTVVRADPGSPESLGPGLVLIVVRRLPGDRLERILQTGD